MMSNLLGRLLRLTDNLAETAKRFPIPVGLMTLAFITLLSVVHEWQLFGWSEDEFYQLYLLLVLGFFAVLAIDLFAETRSWSPLLPLGLSALAILAIGLRIYSLSPDG